MHISTTIATLLLAASSAIAAPSRRQAAAADTKVRVILRNDSGLKQEINFASVDPNISTGVSGVFTTLEVDVGADVDPTLRCAVTAGGRNDVKLFARRGANLDDTFSDSTNGEWTFDEPTAISTVVCDLDFVVRNLGTGICGT